MNRWENTVLTDKGAALQAKLIDGQTLNITKVMTGASKVPVVNLRQQTDVTDGGKRITLQPARTEGDQFIIPVLLENSGLEDSYELWQVGFYAEDPDEGEILYCIAQASERENIPSASESPGFSITWDFYFKTSNMVPFEVILNPNGLVNIEAYQRHTEEIHKANSRIDILNSTLNTIKSHVGMVIHSTTLDTQEKVKAIYGGSAWTKIEGQFLLGVSGNHPIRGNGSTGGSEIHLHSTADHRLSVDEIPSHTHNLTQNLGLRNVYVANGNGYGFATASSTCTIKPTGGGKVHNHGNTGSTSNMPPYKTVYIWERTI